MKHGNLAFFIPHNGCPHQCSFCSQHAITGHLYQPSPQEVEAGIQEALRHSAGQRSLEIAFFGGSFTAIDEGYQEALLAAAAPYVRDGSVQGIRISTRPDAIGEPVLRRLARYGVTAIELGAQSMSDKVLHQNQRGHTARQVEQACAAIQKMGFSLGLQMMVGLDGDTPQETFHTAEKLAALHPDTMRIYPAIVLRGTPLGERFLCGEYEPLKLPEAIKICAELLDFFTEKNIPVIRLGLHDSPQLRQDRLAGPWHPAFRELCDSHRFLLRVQGFFQIEKLLPGSYWMKVPAAWLSRAAGQKRTNLQALSALGYEIRLVPDTRTRPNPDERETLWQLRGPSEIPILMGRMRG